MDEGKGRRPAYRCRSRGNGPLSIETIFGLRITSLLLACLMTFAAALIRGLTGFGLALILVPLLGMILRPDQAVVVSLVLAVLIGPVGLGGIVRDSDRPSVAIIAGSALLTTPLGVWVLAHTPPDIARIAIAAIAIGAFGIVIATRKAVDKPSRGIAGMAGVTAGFLTGFAAMPGPPVVPFYLREAFSPTTARASMMAVFFATSLAGVASAWALGLLTWPLVMLSLALFVPLALGNAIGGIGFGMVPAPIWRSLVAVLLGGAGLSAVWRAFG